MTADERLRLELRARGKPAGLAGLLERAAGMHVGERYVIEKLTAVGSQSYLFTARAAGGQRCMVKQAAFDYTDLLQVGRREARAMRDAIQREWDVLVAAPTGHLPAPIELVKAPAIVPAARDSSILGTEELFLVQELIAGISLREWALGPGAELAPGDRESLLARLAGEFVDFWTALRQAGWHYGDINGTNLMIEARGTLRVVDGGSVVPAGDTVRSSGYTPAFTTPCLYQTLCTGAPVRGDLSSVLPMLAKVLCFALGRVEPKNGELPDGEDPRLAAVSPACRQVLAAWLALDSQPDTLPHALDALSKW